MPVSSITNELRYDCVVCSCVSCVRGNKYLSMDYVKLGCCSNSCKKKFLLKKIFAKTTIPEDVTKIIITF